MTGARATGAAGAEREPQPLRVHVALDDDLFRVGISRLLSDEGLVCVDGSPADVVLVDSGEPIPDDVCVIALCAGFDEAADALMSGAAAALERGTAPGLMADAIRLAAEDTAVMPAAVARELVLRSRGGRDDAVEPETLSAREAEVMDLVAAGHGNDAIAHELTIAASTVKNHVARVMAKLGARNRTEAAVRYSARPPV